MKSFILLAAAASLVSAAPTSFTPISYLRSPPIYNKYAEEHRHVQKRGCDSIPDKADNDVLVRIYKVAKDRAVSDRVMLALFETCWVESHCNNLPCGDQDSVGILQQRTSQGWGSTDQIMNIEYSATKYLDVAVDLDKKEGADVSAGRLAQMVQVSDFPDRYEESKDIGQSLWDQAKQLAGTSDPAPTDPAPTDPSGGGQDDGDDDEDCDDDGDEDPTPTSQTPQPTSTPTDPGDDDDCDDDGDDGPAPPTTTSPPMDPGDDDDCDDDDGDDPTPTSSTPAPTPTDGGDDGDDGDCDDDGDGELPPSGGGGAGDDDGDEDCDDDDDEPSVTSSSAPQPTANACTKQYTVQTGDTCSAVASKNSITLEQFYSWNSGIDSDCQNLEINQAYCVKH